MSVPAVIVSLALYGIDGWHLLESWRARHQFRWNKDSNDMSVKQILEFVLARVGLKLEAMSQSSVVTGFYPDFTIHPDDRGDLLPAVALLCSGYDVYRGGEGLSG